MLVTFSLSSVGVVLISPVISPSAWFCTLSRACRFVLADEDPVQGLQVCLGNVDPVQGLQVCLGNVDPVQGL